MLVAKRLSAPKRTVLQEKYDYPRCHLIAVADVPDSEADQIAAAQLAVDLEIEERKLAYSAFPLQTDSKRPDVLELNGAFWPTILPLFHGSR